MKIAHIINPVKVDKSSDLYTAQPITFESMRFAAEKVHEMVEVELLSTQYPEDLEIIPDYFKKLENLNRSVLDVGSFSRKRKLPLIADIIDILYRSTDAEVLVYTNVDIGLMPGFYEFVKEQIDRGLDAFIINRRRIPEIYKEPGELNSIYQDKGKSHPGFDCFVFKRELVPKFQFGDICLGVPFIGVSFAHNLFCFAENFKLFDKEHLTFHIGMIVMAPRDKEYYWHNRREFNRIKKSYWWDKFDVRKFPYADLPFPIRYIKWGLNPSLFIFMNFKLELRKLFRGI